MEEKTAGLAWHYRAADPEFGAAQAGDLLLHLATLLSNAPAEVLTGDQVVEIRPQGVNKGQVVPAVARPRPARQRWWSRSATTAPTRTSSPRCRPGSVSVHVGPAASRAELRVRNVTEARAFLRGLLDPALSGRAPVDHSAIVVPVPPIGAGRSFIFGSPSAIRMRVLGVVHVELRIEREPGQHRGVHVHQSPPRGAR